MSDYKITPYAALKSPKHQKLSGLGNTGATITQDSAPGKASQAAHDTITRRQFLSRTMASFAFPCLLGQGLLSPVFMPEMQGGPFFSVSEVKKISLLNMHTGESVKNLVFWEQGKFEKGALTILNKVCRDHRTNEMHEMDLKLLLLLSELSVKLGTNQPFHLISGYRSPKTNAMLCSAGSGVAKNSQHCLGKAADISLAGHVRSLKNIADAAKSMRVGGVGSYNHFIHVDTGRVRTW